ncbi:MAG: hypothetical protein HKN03_16530 [Acidimicrobiales bacterium]|nr:hypothetical protein [Acidimicrobiales bacterium]
MPKLVAVFALALMMLGAGCTSSDNEAERAAACSRAVELVAEMTEADSFSDSQLLAQLNTELSTIEAPDDVDAGIQWLNETTTQWITVLESGRQDDSAFPMRDDVVESRLALRRICR